MACSTASAQMAVRIDGNPINDDVIDSITIDPIANELNITTTLNYNVTVQQVGDGVAINSFTASPGTVVAGQNVTFTWNTSNAISCQATGGVDGWAGTTVTPPSGSVIKTMTTVGTYNFTLTCDGSAAGDTTSRIATVTITSPDAVAITSFTASPDSITEGETTTLSWTTVNAESCTPTGGTTDWTSQVISLPSGSANIAIASQGSYTFSLTCQGTTGDEQTKSDVVTVSPESQSCDDVTLAGNIIGWGSFWSAGFPGPTYENVTNRIIPQKGYMAIEFNTGNVNDDGKISALENSSTPGIRIGSFSQCPGDFDVPAECRYTWGLGGGLRWATNNRSGACDLDANTTYYFNITFTDGVDLNTSTCNSTPCRINLQHVNL